MDFVLSAGVSTFRVSTNKLYCVIIFNPRRACAARVTVVVLCVCVYVCMCVHSYQPHHTLDHKREMPTGS